MRAEECIRYVWVGLITDPEVAASRDVVEGHVISREGSVEGFERLAVFAWNRERFSHACALGPIQPRMDER